MFDWLCGSKPKTVFVVYKLKTENIDIVIEIINEKKVKKRLKELQQSRHIYNHIVYDEHEDKAIQKFYDYKT